MRNHIKSYVGQVLRSRIGSLDLLGLKCRFARWPYLISSWAHKYEVVSRALRTICCSSELFMQLLVSGPLFKSSLQEEKLCHKMNMNWLSTLSILLLSIVLALSTGADAAYDNPLFFEASILIL